MRKHADITGIVQNLEYELLDSNGRRTKEWYEFHLGFIYQEARNAADSLLLYNRIRKEWDLLVDKKRISYIRIRNLLFEALPFRIVIDLNKVIANKTEKNYDRFSLRNFIIEIQEQEWYEENARIRNASDNIVNFLDSSEMVSVVKTCRNKLFAHLDKECVISDGRIYPGFVISNIDINEVNKCIDLFIVK